MATHCTHKAWGKLNKNEFNFPLAIYMYFQTFSTRNLKFPLFTVYYCVQRNTSPEEMKLSLLNLKLLFLCLSFFRNHFLCVCVSLLSLWWVVSSWKQTGHSDWIQIQTRWSCFRVKLHTTVFVQHGMSQGLMNLKSVYPRGHMKDFMV